MNFCTKLMKISTFFKPLSLWRLSNFVKLKKLSKMRYTHVIFAYTVASLSAIEIEEPSDVTYEIEEPADYKALLKQFSSINVANIKQLIETLQNAILETCEKYRHCLHQQIKLMENMKNINPLDTFWDDLVKYRAEGKQLKEELQLYESILDHVRHLAYNIDMCSTILQNNDEECLFTYFTELKVISEQELAINKELEDKLLETSVKHVVNTNVL